MRILHLSDFHYQADKNKQFDQDNIIEKLNNTLLEEKKKIDYILFTGDLANDGSSVTNLQHAYDILIKNLMETLSVPALNVFLCAGNHDLHRNQEMVAIKSEFEKITTKEKLDNFVKNENDRQYQESLINFKNFIEFQSQLMRKEEDIINPLYSIQKRQLDNSNIAFVTLNSAWRSQESEKDRGNLYYPISFINQILLNIKDCNFKVLLMHHSISDFKEFITSEIEDQIFQNFHMLLSGHYHKQKTSLNFTSNKGIFCSTSPAALTKTDRHGNIGFTIYDVDIETYDIEITCKYYNDRTKEFDDVEKQSRTIPTNKTKQEQNKLRQTFRKRLIEEIEIANNLFVSNNELDEISDFNLLFTDPILKAKSTSELASNKGKEEPSVSLISVINSPECFVIFGKDKSGRTSLLQKVKLELIGKFNVYNQIPLFIDCKVYKLNESKIDIIGQLKNYFDVNRAKIVELASTYKICLLIDNYDPSYSILNDSIVSFIKEIPNTKYIMCAEESILRTYNDILIDGIKSNKLFIHEITRKEIRTLTQKWKKIPPEKKDVVIEKIIEIFTQLNMPTSYWTVSLFLWIFEKTNEANFHNNFELIQLYIDGLLERKKLALDSTSKITYDDFKTFLGALAHYLITEHHKDNCTASYTDIVNFTENYRKHRKRFVISVEDVIKIVLDRGVIKRNINNRYTFRLNGVFEYFLAYHMTEDEAFKNDIINDSHFYLSFGNEFELYSGFNKKDSDFVEKIFKKTETIFSKLNRTYTFENTDYYFQSKIVEIFDLSTPIQQLALQPETILSPEEKDELYDEITLPMIKEEEVKQKRYYEEIIENEENLEKALFILSRIYRNSSINDEDIEEKILDFIINSACNLGFLLIDETQSNKGNEIVIDQKETDGKTILKLIVSFMPIVVQAFLFDALMQNNLERIIKEKLRSLIINRDSNQFKIFILYFLLIDLDVKNSKNYIDEVIEEIKLSSLKQSILIKLYMYLMLKTHGNTDLEEFIKLRIEKQSRKINPKADIDKINTDIIKQKRAMSLKKISENKRNEDQ